MATLRQRRQQRANEPALSVTDWARQFRPGGQVAYNGNRYQAYDLNSKSDGALYGTNSVVFACEAKRLLLFASARFQFQQLRSGVPGDLFGTPELAPLENPMPGQTTGDLLSTAELDVFSAGNSYWVEDSEKGGLLRLDPSRVKILTESAYDARITGQKVGERLLAYVVENDDRQLTMYLPDEVAHYKPYQTPGNPFLGQSWLSACLPDVSSDMALTEHKTKSLTTGAQLGYVVTYDKDVPYEKFKMFVDDFRENHEGVDNSGKTLFLGAGADVKTVGQSFENLSLKATQGATETRIAACAGTPPVLVGLSEGLQGSSLNQGNYGMAKRQFGDSVLRPLWEKVAAAFQSLVPPPDNSRLWYDDRDIPFLREDVTDQADILNRQMNTIESGIRAGYTPETVIQAVVAGDLSRMKHTGLYSVQLQEPGTGVPPADTAPAV